MACRLTVRVYVMSCMRQRMYETPYAGACAPTLREMTDEQVAGDTRLSYAHACLFLITNRRFV
jgi:hypothetical protein